MGTVSHPPPPEWRAQALPDDLRLFVEQIPALAWATDRELRVLWMVGAGFASLRPSEMVGRTLREVMYESENFEEAIAAHLAAVDGRAGRFENALLGLFAEVRVQPLRGADGRVAGGELAIDSATGAGTVVRARFPLPDGSSP